MAAAAKRALISGGYVHAVEHGRRLPSSGVTARLANAVGADPVRALALHKAVKAADNRAKGERLLALADAGDPEGADFVRLCFELMLDQVGHERLKVRLAEIDTPERNQPYGSRARQALSDLAFNREARVVVVDHDRYGRVVGRVYVDDTDVNAELIHQGAAWVYRDYARDRTLFALEDEARAAKRGLWALPEAQRTPPWEWRQANRAAKPRASSTGQVASSCGAKRTCKQMQDCAEARFYLDTCGLTRLDGDGDGVPCEALCR